jgi:hypothetical protein
MVKKTLKERGITMVGDLCVEQGAWVYLVWGITQDGVCDLLCVAAREVSRERYEEMGQRNKRYHVVQSELVLIDHAFGQSMLPNALNRAR